MHADSRWVEHHQFLEQVLGSYVITRVLTTPSSSDYVGYSPPKKKEENRQVQTKSSGPVSQFVSPISSSDICLNFQTFSTDKVWDVRRGMGGVVTPKKKSLSHQLGRKSAWHAHWHLTVVPPGHLRSASSHRQLHPFLELTKSQQGKALFMKSLIKSRIFANRDISFHFDFNKNFHYEIRESSKQGEDLLPAHKVSETKKRLS